MADSNSLTVFEGTPGDIVSFVNDLPPERYLIELRRVDASAPDRNYLSEAIRKAKNRTREQMLADRAEVLAGSHKAKPLPPGTTLRDVVVDQWPGDETDDQIRTALEELS